MDRSEMRRRLTAARVGRLATADAEGRPHLVPITFAVEGETLCTAVDHKPKTTTALKRLANILENPRVSVLVDHYEEDWDRLWWVRIDGEATVHHEGAEHRRSIGLLEEKYPHYRERPPEGPVIAVRIDRWRGWEARPA